MCGRARCTLRADHISRACYRSHGPARTVKMDMYRPSYNVSPGANLPVVRRADGADGGEDCIELHCKKRGLIPSFIKKSEKPDHYRMGDLQEEIIWHIHVSPVTEYHNLMIAIFLVKGYQKRRARAKGYKFS